MGERVLSERVLNRALLARQSLLERSHLSIEDVVERVGGLQTQYAPSAYVGLWTRVEGFERDSLTRALEERRLIQATLLRGTIHVVTRADYWRYVLGIRRARRAWAARAQALPPETELMASAAALRAALADGPRTVRELDGLAAGFIGNLGLWVDLARVPPSGTWEHRRADRLALAEAWVGPEDATEAEGLAHVVRAYLGAFGPASWRDVASWAGIPVADAVRGGEMVALVRYRDEAGHELVDLEGAAIPDADTPAPIRFLPHWDNNLLVHARRTGLLPEPYRPLVFSTKNPFSVGTYLVDGHVAGAWSVKDGRVVLDPYEALSPAVDGEVEREREALEAFHAGAHPPG